MGFGGPSSGAPFGGPPRSSAPSGDPAARRERNFGPPAPPKGRRGGAGAKGRGDGGPKGPIKVRGGGRVEDLDEKEIDAALAEEFDDFATSAPKGEDEGDE